MAREACADALQWIVPAAVAHLFAGLAASTLAALDDYATRGARLRGRKCRGPRLHRHAHRRRRDRRRVAGDGGQRGRRRSLIPLVVLGVASASDVACRRRRRGPRASRCGIAWRCFVAAAAIPLSLQLAYVVSLPFAGRLGEGAVTSFGYAYLAATTLAGITAFSIGLVSSVPLSRIELDASRGRHGTSSPPSWVALVIVGAAVGVLALAGAELVEAFLGAAYGDEVGDEVAALIVVFSAWMVAAVGVNVTFPLAFVTDRLRALPWIGVAALAVQLPLAWIGVELFELDGLAFSLALSTLLVLAALLTQLGAAAGGLRGIALAAAVVGAFTAAAFVPPRSRRRWNGERARRPRAVRRARSRCPSARPQRVVGVPPRALARLPPLQARAAAVELDECEARPRAEDAMPCRRDGPLGRRQIAKRHAPADPLAFPVERRQLVGELANDHRAVADRALDVPGLRRSCAWSTTTATGGM